MTFADNLRVVFFSDGTKVTTHPTGESVLVEYERGGHPAVEVDLEIDRMCYGHSQGRQVIAQRSICILVLYCSYDNSTGNSSSMRCF